MNTYIMDQFEHMIDLHLKMSHFDSMQSPEGVSMTVHNRSFTFCVFVIDGCMNVILFGKPMEAAPIIETAAAPRSRSVMPATYRHIFPHDLHHHHHHKSFSASMDNSSAIMSPLSSSLFASSGPRNASSSKTKYSRLNSTPNSTSVSSASLFSGRNWPLGRYRAERFPVPASKNSPFIVDDPDFPFPRQVYQDKKCKSMYERRHGRAPWCSLHAHNSTGVCACCHFWWSIIAKQCILLLSNSDVLFFDVAVSCNENLLLFLRHYWVKGIDMRHDFLRPRFYL